MQKKEAKAPVASRKVPTGQGVQVTEPTAGEKEPTVQGTQADDAVAPDEGWKVPARQLRQIEDVDAPVVAEYVPPGHSVQAAAPMADM